jgi:diguanylate cyclase (GGDEF)-like protein
MPLRISAESRVIAAFVATTTALFVVAWLLVSTARAFIADAATIDAWLDGDPVLSNLSSTIDDSARNEVRALSTKRGQQLVAQIRAKRGDARRHLESAKAWGTVLAALAIVFVAVAASALRSSLRERDRLASLLAAEQNHDPLTGLPNRRFFSEWLSFAIGQARRENAHVGVLFIDINGCTAVAELHGGPVVEALLVEVARRFRAAARDGDVFARLGASEFALATPNANDVREMALLAQRLRDALHDPAQAPLADTPIGTSIGVAFFPEDADDSAGVMAAANAAMFAARRAGRNHVAFNAIAA